jgi:hypothetical protein
VKSHSHLGHHHALVLGVVRTCGQLTVPEIADKAQFYLADPLPEDSFRLRVARCLGVLRKEGLVEHGPRREGLPTWVAKWTEE